MNIEAIRTLVDPGAVLSRVRRMSRLQERGLESARARSFWTKPGRYFNACYVLAGNEDQSEVVVSGFVVGSSLPKLKSEWQSHECSQVSADLCGACSTLADDELGLLWQLFPFDYRLPGLRSCLDPALVRPHLRNVVRCSLAGYRPGMRCQIRYESEDASLAFGKVAVERDPGKAFERHARISEELATTGANLRLPSALAYIEDLGLSLIAAAPGESLHDRLRRRAHFDAGEIARSLASLHAVDLPSIERVYHPDDELGLLASWIALIEVLFPSLAAKLRACQDTLVERCPARSAGRALVHRDFYDKQILLCDGDVTLLDMDTACRGDAEIDLGNFCAHLELRALQWNAPGAFAPLGRDFARAYPHAVNAERISWYRAAALLRLACVYALRPHWRRLVPALLATVEAA